MGCHHNWRISYVTNDFTCTRCGERRSGVNAGGGHRAGLIVLGVLGVCVCVGIWWVATEGIPLAANTVEDAAGLATDAIGAVSETIDEVAPDVERTIGTAVDTVSDTVQDVVDNPESITGEIISLLPEAVGPYVLQVDEDPDSLPTTAQPAKQPAANDEDRPQTPFDRTIGLPGSTAQEPAASDGAGETDRQVFNVTVPEEGGSADGREPGSEPRAAADPVAEWREYMLELINAERSAAGLDPVALGDNPAAQAHADSMLAGCFSSHWGLDGLKPYMRYSLAGGYQSSAENVSGLSYCIKPWENYVGTSLERDIREAAEGFMQSPGHRDNVLDPHHAAVNLGLAWDDYNMMVVQHFEYGYAVFDEPPAIRDGFLSFSGTAVNGAGFGSADDLMVQIYYDQPPRSLAPGQVARTYCYDHGLTAAALVAPPPPGSYYTTSSYQETSTPCPDPYDVPANAPAPASPGQAHDIWYQSYLASLSTITTRTVPFHTASEWRVLGDSFAVGADIGRILERHGPGVYTVTVWGTADGEAVPIAERSIFHGTDPPQ